MGRRMSVRLLLASIVAPKVCVILFVLLPVGTYIDIRLCDIVLVLCQLHNNTHNIKSHFDIGLHSGG